MGEKIAVRAAYGEALKKYGLENPNVIVLDADLAGATYSKYFADACPERFFDCGIAEANMMGVAAGLATTGKIPFVNSFAMFSCGRSYDQARNSVAYPHLNVKIVGTHAGLAAGEDGATHQCLEDIALMRALPGMTIFCPCDAHEADLAVKAAIELDGPCYLRIGRNPVDTVTDSISGYRFVPGKGSTLREGGDVAIIATGLMVQEALSAAKTLASEGIEATVIDMHTIKPIDRELIVEVAKRCGVIVTSEDHNILGGLGGAVAEVVSECCPVPVLRNGVNDQFGHSGKAQDVLDAYGVNAQGIAELARKAVALKRG